MCGEKVLGLMLVDSFVWIGERRKFGSIFRGDFSLAHLGVKKHYPLKHFMAQDLSMLAWF
jgi:hypothetical protein